MKSYSKIFLLFFSLLLIYTSCEKDETIFARENNKLFVDCTEQSIEQIILSEGDWYADASEVNWITVSPENGTGNGVDYGTFNINVAYHYQPTKLTFCQSASART